METENKTKSGFFDQIAFSVQPDKYKELVLLPKKTVVFYMLLIGICLSIMNYVIPMAGWMTSFGGLDHLIKEELPRIEFSKGVLDVESKIEIGKDTLQHFLVDTTKEKVTPEEIDKEKYPMEVLVSRTNMLIYAEVGGIIPIDFSMYKDAQWDNSTLLQMKPMIYAVMIIQFFSSIVKEIMQYLIGALPLAFVAWMVGAAERKNRLKFSQIFALTIYAKTAVALFASFNASANLLENPFLIAYGGMFLTVMLLVTGIKKVEGITK